MKGTNKKRVVKVVLPMLALALSIINYNQIIHMKSKYKLGVLAGVSLLSSSCCYFNTAGHIFDAASHDVCVKASDIKIGQKIYSDGSNYYLTLPKYRHEPEVITQWGIGTLNRSVARPSEKEGEQVLKLTPQLVQYLTSGLGNQPSLALVPVDSDVLQKSSCVGSVNYTCESTKPHVFTETSSAAPVLYFLGALDWLCVDLPITLTENALVIGTSFPVPITLKIMADCVGDGEGGEILNACKNGDYATVKRYVDAGVDFGDFDGPFILPAMRIYPSRPMQAALDNGHHSIVKLLQEGGFNKYNSLDISNVVLRGDIELATEMHSKGAYVDIKNGPFLELLRENNILSCAKLVPWLSSEQLYEEYNFEFKTMSGLHCAYLLHIAADFGDAEMVRNLLSRGFNVNCKSKGYTPMDIAEHANHSEVVSVLRSHGGVTSGKVVYDYVAPRLCSECKGNAVRLETRTVRVPTVIKETQGLGTRNPYEVEKVIYHEETETYQWRCPHCDGKGSFKWDPEKQRWY